ncbi:hypothetical protein [Atribacter sp.]
MTEWERQPRCCALSHDGLRKVFTSSFGAMKVVWGSIFSFH